MERFLRNFAWDTRSGVVCVQCHDQPEKFLVAKTKRFELIFCSHECAHAYWMECQQFERDPSSYQQGTGTCRFPRCDKACFQEGQRVHDFCGVTHAKEYATVISSGNYQRRTYQRQMSGGHNTPTLDSGQYTGCCQTGPIKFYNRGEPYFEFTNFYEAVVTINDEEWLTTEHYFQAQKFIGTPLVGTIRMLERPREAFNKSRDPRYSFWQRSDWEEVKEEVMYKALQSKFIQHSELRQQLIDTRDRKLIEHTPYDSYWGDGGDGSGKNRLGELLMRLREEMKPKITVVAPLLSSTVHVEPSPPASQPSPQSHGENPGSPDSIPVQENSAELAGQPIASCSRHNSSLSQPEKEQLNSVHGSQNAMQPSTIITSGHHDTTTTMSFVKLPSQSGIQVATTSSATLAVPAPCHSDTLTTAGRLSLQSADKVPVWCGLQPPQIQPQMQQTQKTAPTETTTPMDTD